MCPNFVTTVLCPRQFNLTNVCIYLFATCCNHYLNKEVVVLHEQKNYKNHLSGFEKQETKVASTAATNLSFLYFLQGELDQVLCCTNLSFIYYLQGGS